MRLLSAAPRILIQVAAIATAALLMSQPVALADVHALIIGINDYDHQPKLEGAVADADDIVAALRGIKARSILLLKDHDATKKQIVEAFESMMRNARTADTIVFAYAGHGGQEPYPPGKPSGRAESFLLAAFTPKGPASAERMLDKEVNAWLRRAGGKGLKVIFVADSCHAGGMTRQWRALGRGTDERAAVTYRSIPDYGIPDVLLSSHDLKVGAERKPDDLPHVTFFAATQADKRSPEILINGRKRGALSYAFARALEGAADRKGTGTLSPFELAAYITPTVRQLSEAQQTPDIVYRSDAAHEPLLSGIPSRKLQIVPAQDVRLYIANGDQVARDGLSKVLVGAAVVADAASADLVWDAKDLTVVSGLGDPVAHAIAPARLQAVIDKWRILPAIKRMAAERALAMTMSPGDARHPVGRQVVFESGPLPYANVTVFNLAPDGGVQFLYPKPGRQGDPRSLMRGEPYRLPLKVEPPLGADHLIVIASAAPLAGLHALLRAAPPTIDLPQLLRESLAGQDYALGLQGLYTTDSRQTP